MIISHGTVIMISTQAKNSRFPGIRDGLTAADGKIRVTVADQWATGIGGYEIEYRKEGEDNWQTVTLTDGQTETELPEPEAGAVFEVRARATVDGVMPIIQLPTPCYGEYSDTVTITVP